MKNVSFKSSNVSYYNKKHILYTFQKNKGLTWRNFIYGSILFYFFFLFL